MKKYRRIKIAFKTTEILVSPGEAAPRPVSPVPHCCPLCHSPLADAVGTELLVLSDEIRAEPEPAPEHICR